MQVPADPPGTNTKNTFSSFFSSPSSFFQTTSTLIPWNCSHTSIHPISTPHHQVDRATTPTTMTSLPLYLIEFVNDRQTIRCVETRVGQKKTLEEQILRLKKKKLYDCDFVQTNKTKIIYSTHICKVLQARKVNVTI